MAIAFWDMCWQLHLVGQVIEACMFCYHVCGYACSVVVQCSCVIVVCLLFQFEYCQAMGIFLMRDIVMPAAGPAS